MALIKEFFMTTNMIPGSPEANQRLKNAVMTRDPKILKDIIKRCDITSDEIIKYRDENGNTLIYLVLSTSYKNLVLPTIRVILDHCKGHERFVEFINNESHVNTWLLEHVWESYDLRPYIIIIEPNNIRNTSRNTNNITSSITTANNTTSPISVTNTNDNTNTLRYTHTGHDPYHNQNGVDEIPYGSAF